MQLKGTSAVVLIAAVLASVYYAIEPWAATFVDDGPYYSTEYLGAVDELPVPSRVELRRFGRSVHVLESRTLPVGNESVLVLRTPDGSVQWARVPVKPNGELGRIKLRKIHATWYGGWRISIKPENQESGNLYLSALGNFRFFNHSW